MKKKKREIEELNNAQELADLVKTKHKVIEELKNSLVEARNCVSAMEVCPLSDCSKVVSCENMTD